MDWLVQRTSMSWCPLGPKMFMLIDVWLSLITLYLLVLQGRVDWMPRKSTPVPFFKRATHDPSRAAAILEEQFNDLLTRFCAFRRDKECCRRWGWWPRRWNNGPLESEEGKYSTNMKKTMHEWRSVDFVPPQECHASLDWTPVAKTNDIARVLCRTVFYLR